MLTAGVVCASASLTLGGGKEQRTAKGKPGFVSVAAQLAIAPDAALRSLARRFCTDRAAPVNLALCRSRGKILRAERRTANGGRERLAERLRRFG